MLLNRTNRSWLLWPRLIALLTNTEMTNESEDIQAVEELGIVRDGAVKEPRKVIVGLLGFEWILRKKYDLS